MTSTNILKSQIRHLFKYWIPVMLSMVVIFWMSTGTFSSDNTSPFIVSAVHFFFPDMQMGDVELLHGMIRKGAHIIEYFILSFFLFRAFRQRSSNRWSLRWAILAVFVSAVYAFSDEFHQSFVSTRTASLLDVWIDTIGGIMAQIAIACWNLMDRKRCYPRL